MNQIVEDLIRRYPEWRHQWETMPPLPAGAKLPKPKPVLASILVSEALAAAAKANPDSVTVRVKARAEDGTLVLDPPRRGYIVGNG